MTVTTPHGQEAPTWLAGELQFRLEQEQEKALDPSLRSDTRSETLYAAETRSPRVIPTKSAWQLYFTQEVAFDWMLSGQMYVLTLATGLLDATTYQAYKVFATKMTGNLLLLAIDAVDPSAVSAYLEQIVATAIGCFILGAAAFGHIGRLVGRRRRLYLLITNLLQTSLVFAATAIQYWESTPNYEIAKIALLAFAMAGQVSLAIGVGLPELNTTMITASLIQLCYDPKLLSLDNRPRTRRLAFIGVMAAGHFAGAAASRHSVSLGILLAAVVKGVVTLSFFFNHGIVPEKAGDGESPQTKSGTITPAVQVLWGD